MLQRMHANKFVHAAWCCDQVWLRPNAVGVHLRKSHSICQMQAWHSIATALTCATRTALQPGQHVRQNLCKQRRADAPTGGFHDLALEIPLNFGLSTPAYQTHLNEPPNQLLCTEDSCLFSGIMILNALLSCWNSHCRCQ
jgi:hypothetical protein